jgi:hypothetical protein
MKQKVQTFSIIHLAWLLATVVLALLDSRDLIPPAFVPLFIWWTLIGLLVFIIIMIRQAIQVKNTQKMEKMYLDKIKDIKAEMFDLEKEKNNWQRKVQTAEIAPKKPSDEDTTGYSSHK